MAATNNTALPPVPVNTPMLTTLGLVAWEWLAFFGGLVTQLLANTPPFSDSVSLVKDDLDATKQARLEIGGLTTATTRVVTLPDHDVTVESNDHLNAASGATLTCSTIYADISNLNVTLNKSGVWLILVTFGVSLDTNALGIFGKLVINGVDQTDLLTASVGITTTSFAGTVGQHWLYTNTGSNVAKMQAKSGAAAGTRDVGQSNTKLTAIYLHP